MRKLLISAAVLVLQTAAFSGTSTDLRVWRTYGDAFDLTLTAVFRPDGTNLTASFNHRSGRTFFVAKGGRIGMFVVEDLASEGRYDGIASLRHTATKELYELVLNEPLETPGLRAQIVDIQTGSLWDLRTLDEIPSHGLKIKSIGENSVTATAQSGEIIIPPTTEEDRTVIQATWLKAREIRLAEEKADQLARQKKEHDEAGAQAAVQAAFARKPVPPLNIELKTAPQVFFGTEYRYPSAYEYLINWQPVGRGVSNIPQVIAIPTVFAARRAGWTVGGGGQGDGEDHRP